MLELNTNLLPMCALYIFIIRVYCFYYNMNGFQMSDYRFFFVYNARIFFVLPAWLINSSMNAGNIQVLEGTEDHDCPKRMFNLHFFVSVVNSFCMNKLSLRIVNVSLWRHVLRMVLFPAVAILRNIQQTV